MNEVGNLQEAKHCMCVSVSVFVIASDRGIGEVGVFDSC